MTPNLGEVLIAADGASLARTAAHLVRAWLAEAAATNPDRRARVAISGGSTPRVMNRILADLSLPWTAIEWFWVDDRFVPHDHPRSNYGAAREDLFQRGHVPSHPTTTGVATFASAIPPSHIHPMPAGPGHLEAAADTYEDVLADSFGLARPKNGGTTVPVFDLVLLGVGDDGHTASLFPGDPYVDVTDRWVIAVPEAADREARVTLSRPVLTAARRVAVLAQGASKKGPITRARSEGPLRDTPSRLTREVRGELLWLVDSAAAPLRRLRVGEARAGGSAEGRLVGPPRPPLGRGGAAAGRGGSWTETFTSLQQSRPAEAVRFREGCTTERRGRTS